MQRTLERSECCRFMSLVCFIWLKSSCKLLPFAFDPTASCQIHNGPSYEEISDEDHEEHEEEQGKGWNEGHEEEGSEQDCTRQVGKGGGLQRPKGEDGKWAFPF